MSPMLHVEITLQKEEEEGGGGEEEEKEEGEEGGEEEGEEEAYILPSLLFNFLIPFLGNL